MPAALTIQPAPQTQVKIHLHGSEDLALSFITAIWIDPPAPDVVVYGDAMYRRHWEHSQRLRRPIYVRASYLITGPMAQRHGLDGQRGAA
jgi:hypothetical protein